MAAVCDIGLPLAVGPQPWRDASKVDEGGNRYGGRRIPLHPEAVPEFRFIPPCSRNDQERAVGDAWLHEVKFDGYRVHKAGSRVVIFSRNGRDFTQRFPPSRSCCKLPAKAAVLDGKVVASDADGRPNFARLHVRWTRPGLSTFGHRPICGRPAVSLSQPFENGLALLRVAD